MMKIKQHSILIIVCFFAWLLFLILGIPSNYYLDYSVTTRILIAIATFLFFVPPVTFGLLRFMKEVNLFTVSIYFSLYATVGIFIFDFFYCGLYQGYELGFVKSHWLQTSGYFFPWFEIPIIGYFMERSRKITQQAAGVRPSSPQDGKTGGSALR